MKNNNGILMMLEKEDEVSRKIMKNVQEKLQRIDAAGILRV